MSGITCSVEADLAPSQLDGLARDLRRDLSRAGARAQPVEMPAGPGERGVVANIGWFFIEAVGAKTATAVLEVVKAYLTREKTLRLSLTKPDGTKIEIDAKNVSSARVAEFLGVARSITG